MQRIFGSDRLSIAKPRDTISGLLSCEIRYCMTMSSYTGNWVMAE